QMLPSAPVAMPAGPGKTPGRRNDFIDPTLEPATRAPESDSADALLVTTTADATTAQTRARCAPRRRVRGGVGVWMRGRSAFVPPTVYPVKRGGQGIAAAAACVAGATTPIVSESAGGRGSRAARARLRRRRPDRRSTRSPRRSLGRS